MADPQAAAFDSVYDHNCAVGFVHTFYSAWEDYALPSTVLSDLGHPDGCQLDLSLLGKFQGVDGVKKAYEAGAAQVNRSAHNILDVVSQRQANGDLVVDVKMWASLEYKDGSIKMMAFRSHLVLGRDARGNLRFRSYKVQDL